MASRTTPSGNKLSSDENPPRERVIVLAELIADRIYDLSGDIDYDRLVSALERMLREGTLHAALEGA